MLDAEIVFSWYWGCQADQSLLFWLMDYSLGSGLCDGIRHLRGQWSGVAVSCGLGVFFWC